MPAASSWALAALGGLLVAAGTGVIFRARRRPMV
jgi:LPXTG-motif cell wall-anchored protein